MDIRPYAVVNKTVLSLRLKSDVSVMALSSIGREFHPRGPATDNDQYTVMCSITELAARSLQDKFMMTS